MHDKESVWMKGLKIGIVGIGKTSSVGFVLAHDLVVGNHMDSIDELLLNSRNEAQVNDTIGEHLLAKDRAEKYMHKIKYATKEQIAKEADITFFCYEAGGFGASGFGFPFWEPDARKKLYAGNIIPIIKKNDKEESIAKIFEKTQSQCVFVTNPCLDIALAFQEHAELEDGQVLAINPDYFRFLARLKNAVVKNPHIAPYMKPDNAKIWLLGDHGSLCRPFYPRADIDKFGFSLEALVEDVKSEGLRLVSEFGNTSYNIVHNMIDLIDSTKNEVNTDYNTIFVWGVPYTFDGKKIFNSLPFVNKTKTVNGRNICRAEKCLELISEYEDGDDFNRLCNDLYTAQQELRENKFTAPYSHGVVSFNESEPLRTALKVCNYHKGDSDYQGLFGNEPIDCGTVVERIASSGYNLAAITRGKDSGKKKIPQLMCWDFSPESRREICTPLVFASGMKFMALALDGKRAYFESHNRRERKSYITVVEDGKIVNQKAVDFVPTAFGISKDCLYCADDTDQIRVLAKNSLEEKLAERIPAPVKLETGSYINEIRVLPYNQGQVICARTNVLPEQKNSRVFVLNNGKVIRDLKVPNYAFAAECVDGKPLLFYGATGENKNKLVLDFLDESIKPQNIQIDSEIRSLAFDPHLKYLYIGSRDKVTVMPYSSFDCGLIEKPDHWKIIPVGNGARKICVVKM